MARKHGNDTDIIHAEWWDEGESVTIRRYMTHGIKKAIESSIADYVDVSGMDLERAREEGKPDMSGVKIDMRKVMEIGQDVQLLEMIVSWTLKDSAGNILPLDQEGLDDLVEEDIAFITSEIDKRNPSQMTPEQRDTFLAMRSNGTKG